MNEIRIEVTNDQVDVANLCNETNFGEKLTFKLKLQRFLKTGAQIIHFPPTLASTLYNGITTEIKGHKKQYYLMSMNIGI